MQILRHFTWWVDGKSLHMEVDELTPPSIKDKLEGLYFGGQEIDIALGLEKLEAKAKLATWNPDIAAKMGLAPGKRIRSTFRGQTVDEIDGVSRTVIIVMEHRISGEPENWKSGDKSGVSHTLNSILFYKHTVDERVIHHIDPQNFVRIVDGVDQLRDAREALGIGF
jgi:P2 family phage contractile tail tube protein